MTNSIEEVCKQILSIFKFMTGGSVSYIIGMNIVIRYLDSFAHPTRVLQKVLSLGSDYFSATFYQTYFYYKPSKYSPFTETHYSNLFTQSRKADK